MWLTYNYTRVFEHLQKSANFDFWQNLQETKVIDVYTFIFNFNVAQILIFEFPKAENHKSYFHQDSSRVPQIFTDMGGMPNDSTLPYFKMIAYCKKLKLYR